MTRVEAELKPALPESARREAVTFLGEVERSLRAGRISALQAAIQNTAERWSRQGLSRVDIHRALLAPVLPPDLFEALHGDRDPWADVMPRFTEMLEAMPMPALLADADAIVRFANASFRVAAGTEQPVGRRIVEMVCPESREWIVEHLGRPTVAGGGSRIGRVRLDAAPDREWQSFALPLAPHGHEIGWFMALMPEPGQTLADPALVGALRRARDHQEKLTALLAVSQAMMNSLELEDVLGTMARQVRRVFQVDECTVFLYDEREEILKPVVCDVERYREEIMSLRLKLGEGITGSVAASGRPEVVNVAGHDPRGVQVPGTPDEDPSSLLCVPLHSSGKVVGVMTLVHLDGRPFAHEDLESATLFAGLCSAALANARSFEATRSAFEELRQTQAQLVQSAKLNALGELAGGVAHDFNNILAAILGRTQLLLQEAESPTVRSQLRVIERAALDGASTVRRVQEFTRVRHDAPYETVDLNIILEEVLELTRPVWEEGARRRGIQIEAITRFSARQTVAGNASELREVFTNLVLNAVDALPWGGELEIRTRDDGAQLIVSLRDNGIGMNSETRQRIFDPFFTTKSVKGTGLGLSVAYGIVSRHGGEIVVESEMHLGTEFTLRFPAGAGREIPVVTAPLGPLPRLRVLVVDDEEAVLEVLADLLRVLEQEVVTAHGGAAGRDAFLAGDFDVVFSDLGMPDLNGWDLALAVKSARPDAGVVLVTGWGTQVEGGAALAHGVDLVMSKPVSIDDLDRALRQVDARRYGRKAA